MVPAPKYTGDLKYFCYLFIYFGLVSTFGDLEEKKCPIERQWSSGKKAFEPLTKSLLQCYPGAWAGGFQI